MFRELNQQLKTQIPSYAGEPIFELHPAQLYGYMEAVWETWRRLDEGSLTSPPGSSSPTGAKAVVVALGTADRRAHGREGPPLPHLSEPIIALLRARDTGLGSLIPGPRPALDVEAAVRVVLEKLFQPGAQKHVVTPWLHLIYAYLIENTRLLDILGRVIQQSLTDEAFGTLSDRSFRWMRVTEDLFFRDGPSSLIPSITSALRRDVGATRRNAYWRFFGMDLNHGAEDGGAYPYLKAQVANTDFVRTLQDLLRELWRGFVNAGNSSGPKPTDDANISELLAKLKTMLIARRLSTTGGAQSRANLAREEFVAVTTLEWFAMAVDSDTPIVLDLKASGEQPEDRAKLLGDRAKVAAHGRSRNFFQLAARLPSLLREIEEGDWDVRPVAELYDPARANNTSERTTLIVNHWSLATGVDLKSIPVAPGPR
jgi:hypothetical protein